MIEYETKPIEQDYEVRILIIRLSAMGDVIHTLPLARLLKKRLKNVSIDWLVNTAYMPLLKGNTDIDQIIEFPKKSVKKTPLKVLSKLRKILHKRKYTHVFDPQGLAKSGLLSCLSGADIRVGFDRNTSREFSWLMYNRRLDSKMFGPSVVSMNMGLAASIGIHSGRDFLNRSSAKLLGPWLFPEKTGDINIPKKRFILISPCAGWPTKEWPAESYSNLINMLSEKYSVPIRVIWAGEKEREVAEKIAGASAAEMLLKTDISEMISTINSSSLFIAGDTGPMHVANFLGIPCASVFTASDSLRNGPWFQPALVLTPDIKCCGCKKRSCPELLCVEKVTSKMFYNAIIQRFSGLFEDKGR